MLKGLKFGLVLGGLLFAAGSADACWFQRNSCSSTPTCATPCPPAPQYVEKKVTAYRCVTKEKEVEVTVNEYVPRQVEVKYTAYEMKTEPVKQKVVRYECVPVEKEMKVVCMEMRMVEEKRKVCEYQRTMKEVEHKYTEMVPEYKKVMKKVITWKCDTKVVEEIVPVCRKVMVRCEPDPCAGCLARCFPQYRCETVVENRKVCRTVVTRTPVETEVECMQCTYKPVERVCKRMVCEVKPVEKEVMVKVCKPFPVEKTVKCCTVQRREIVEEVTVNVCKCVPVEKTCMKTVYDCKPTKKKVKQCWTEMEPYETVIKVPVGCPTVSCSSPRRGFFCCN